MNNTTACYFYNAVRGRLATRATALLAALILLPPLSGTFAQIGQTPHGESCISLRGNATFTPPDVMQELCTGLPTGAPFVVLKGAPPAPPPALTLGSAGVAFIELDPTRQGPKNLVLSEVTVSGGSSNIYIVNGGVEVLNSVVLGSLAEVSISDHSVLNIHPGSVSLLPTLTLNGNLGMSDSSLYNQGNAQVGVVGLALLGLERSDFTNGGSNLTLGSGGQAYVKLDDNSLLVGNNLVLGPGSVTLTVNNGSTIQVANVSSAFRTDPTPASTTITVDASTFQISGQLALDQDQFFNNGTTSLLVRNGGLLSTGSASITGSSSINVNTQGSWTNSGTIEVGTGTLEITNNGFVSSERLQIDRTTFPIGNSVLVSDPGSKLSVQTLDVGGLGAGEMIIQKGASVEVKGVATVAGMLHGSLVLVSDVGSKLSVQTLDVGGRLGSGEILGPGEMIIQKGASVEVKDLATLGAERNSSSITVNSGSLLQAGWIYIYPTSTLTVTGPGSAFSVLPPNTGVGVVLGGGQLVIADGGVARIGDGTNPRSVKVGENLGPSNQPQSVLTVTGHGSELYADEIDIGIFGSNGKMTVDQGGVVTSTMGVIGPTTTPHAANPASIGLAILTGSGTTWRTKGLFIGLGPAVNGSGTLSILDGALVSVITCPNCANIYLGPSGTIVLNGGMLEGNVFNNGGVITQIHPGVQMLLNGSYTQLAGEVDLEIAGLTPDKFDRFVIHGTGDFEGGFIHLTFLDGFVPHMGDTFDLLMADQGLTFTKNMFIFSGLEPGFEFDTQFLNGDLILSALNDAVPTPEANTFVLFGSGLVGLWLVAAQRRRISIQGGSWKPIWSWEIKFWSIKDWLRKL